MHIHLTQQKFSLTLLKALFFLFASFTSLAVDADSISLTESRTEKLKCVNKKDPISKVKYKSCTKTSTGKYSVTAKVGLTIAILEALSKGIPKTTPLSLSVGDYVFSGSLANASKSSKTSGTWYITHPVCVKKAAVTGQCQKTTQVKDGTINLSGGLGGVVVKVTGNSNGIAGFGKTVFANTCAASAQSPVVLPGNAVLSIGAYYSFDLPLSVNCNVTRATLDSEAKTGGPFNLLNLKVTGKSVPKS